MTPNLTTVPRRASHRGVRRGLTAFAVLAFVGAGAFVALGVRSGQGAGPVLVVNDAVAAVPPSTVPPLVTTMPPTVTTLPSPDTTVPGSASTDPPAAASSTDAPDAPVLPRVQPVGMRISTIDVSDYPVRPVGIQEDGELEIPDETEIGWYKYGATAGHPGATVLVGHVDWGGVRGPFAYLGSVEPGDQVEVSLEDGTTRKYEVTERMMYGKYELPKERIWRNSGPEELVLITCGGDYNPEIRRYKHNIVVYAVPVGFESGGAPR